MIDFVESTTVKMCNSVNNGNTESDKNGIRWRHKKDVDKIYSYFAILRWYLLEMEMSSGDFFRP